MTEQQTEQQTDEQRARQIIAGFTTGMRVRVTRHRAPDVDNNASYMGREGTLIALDPTDPELPFQVQIDDSPFLRLWMHRVECIDPAPETEPAPEVERVDWQARYERLATTLAAMAKDQEWCTEFEDVMSDAGFDDIRCQRKRTWMLTFEVTYSIDGNKIDDILRETFGGAHDADGVDVVSRVRIEWTDTAGDHPRDLGDDDLADILTSRGYSESQYVDFTLIDWDES